mmetsp:Transcript_77486/g.185781  ORF Transcript_77486/g.185781 Transcript_77486/m.185781 type:complete len:241 (-) Transcript_77486:766-1488(-)
MLVAGLLVDRQALTICATVGWRHPNDPLLPLLSSTAGGRARIELRPSTPLAVQRTGLGVASLILCNWPLATVTSVFGRDLLTPRPRGHSTSAALGAGGPWRPVCEFTVNRTRCDPTFLYVLELRRIALLATVGCEGDTAASDVSAVATRGRAIGPGCPVLQEAVHGARRQIARCLVVLSAKANVATVRLVVRALAAPCHHAQPTGCSACAPGGPVLPEAIHGTVWKRWTVYALRVIALTF